MYVYAKSKQPTVSHPAIGRGHAMGLPMFSFARWLLIYFILGPHLHALSLSLSLSPRSATATRAHSASPARPGRGAGRGQGGDSGCSRHALDEGISCHRGAPLLVVACHYPCAACARLRALGCHSVVGPLALFGDSDIRGNASTERRSDPRTRSCGRSPARRACASGRSAKRGSLPRRACSRRCCAARP